MSENFHAFNVRREGKNLVGRVFLTQTDGGNDSRRREQRIAVDRSKSCRQLILEYADTESGVIQTVDSY